MMAGGFNGFQGERVAGLDLRSREIAEVPRGVRREGR
jgi:hypothetical protein